MIGSNKMVLEEKKSVAVKKLHFFIICNYTLESCIKKYIKETHNYYIPYDFITFYFNECQKTFISDSYLNAFFLCFNNKIVEFDKIIEVYSKSKYPALKSKVIAQDSMLRGLKAGTYLIIDKNAIKKSLNYTVDSPELQNALIQLNSIIDDINSTKHLVKAKYEIFRKQKKVPDANRIESLSKEQSTLKHKPLNIDKRAVTPPSQGRTEKVSRLIIPKLRIIGMYPKSITLSRVDSRYFAYAFTTPANEVRLINIYHLKRVAMKKGFIEKRESIMNSGKKKSRFDDLF